MEMEDSSETVRKFTRRALYNILKEFKGKKMEEKFSLMEEKLLEITKCPADQKIALKRPLRCFKSDFKKKWTASSYMEQRFLKNNERWLISSIELPYWSAEPTQKPERPIKTFEELSERSQRRKKKELREQVPVEELTHAASGSQRTSGNNDASKLIKEITPTTTRATNFHKVISPAQKQIVVRKLTPEEALAIFVEGDFSREQWDVIHEANKSIYPCYSLIKKAKSQCYPNEQSIRVTETCSEVELQALLDHTALRLYKYVTEVIETCSQEEKQNMVLISKWGCDGAQQSEHKQNIENDTDIDVNIFQSSFVPLRLVIMIDGDEKKIIWQNPVPSSIRFCRPIRIRFINESKDVIKSEVAYIKNQAANLKETQLSTPNGLGKNITHKMILTMIDENVCNAATDTASTMRCNICGQTSNDFNKLIVAEEVNEETLKFGLSILHARIHFFESLLHLAYKLPLKKWQARTAEEKKIVKETKEKIQTNFKQMGVLVDIPKPGLRNTNDSNTSKRFFADPECSSRITGINVALIKRFKVMLEVISSGNSIDVDKFGAFAHETAKMYRNLYGWHPMSPTIHKILMHGPKVISTAILPIAQLSEEVAEVRNMHIRYYQLNFATKFSRVVVDCNRDILKRLLLTSDPYLSCSRPKQHKKSKPFSMEAINLMVAGTPHLRSNENDSDESLEEDEEYEDEQSESD